MNQVPLEQLLLRAFGGEGVADAPVREPADTWWPVSPPAPAAAEALDLFLREVGASASRRSWLVFLGGPGNGKSALGKKLAEESSFLYPLDAEAFAADAPHRRSYDFATADGQRVRLINDATIRSNGASVTGDFRAALDERMHLVVNANRGVLVEDRSALPEDLTAAALLEYLIDEAGGRAYALRAGFHLESRPIGESSDHHYLSQALFVVDGHEFALRVVKLDSCSLLEPRPEVAVVRVEGSGEEWLRGSRYRIADLRDRSARLNSSAGHLFGEVARSLDNKISNRDAEIWRADWNPIAANVAALSSEAVRTGLLRVLRAAEITSGRLFTFRELWGALALVYLGPVSRDGFDLDQFERLLSEFGNTGSGAETVGNRLKLLLKLSRFRFSQALFREPPLAFEGRGIASPPRTPVTDRVRAVDPVLDAVPGSTTDLSAGWASPALDAIEAMLFEDRALDLLVEGGSDALAAVVTPFDRLVEATILEWRTSGTATDKEFDAVIAWYGRYTLRLYALAEGLPSFGRELRAWTLAWGKASSQGVLDDAMADRVRKLLAPSLAADGGNEWVLLPVFGSRVEPMRDLPDAPRLVARFKPSDLEMRANASAEQLILELVVRDELIAEIDFDFPLLREAMVCDNNHAGATDAGSRCTPRVERARASLLAPNGVNNRWAVVDRGRVGGLTILNPEDDVVG